MIMLTPTRMTESEALVAYVDHQLDGIRCATFGLTDEQAHLTPTRSAFNIGAVLKHATYVMDGFVSRHEAGGFEPTADNFDELAAKFADSFVFGDDEHLDGVLERFDRSRASFIDSLRAIDPDADSIEPPAPWDNRPEPAPITWRYALLHMVEELARHAGHVDIIREQIDGATAGELMFGAHGVPGNDFVKPWSA